MDVTVHKGEVLAMTDSGYICRWDMKDGAAAVSAMLPRPYIHIDYTADGHAFYLTSSSGGDLQLVYMYGEKDADYMDRRCLRVINDSSTSSRAVFSSTSSTPAPACGNA